MLGRHTIKTWSKTQTLLALSSGESEFYAALKASAEGLGMMSLMKDFNYAVTGEVWGDASAALGIIHRKGLGRTRHIDTGLLWIQQTAAEKGLKYNKILGTINPADLMTKYLSAEVNEKHCGTLGVWFEVGRATTAPTLSHVMEGTATWEYDDEVSTDPENSEDEAMEAHFQHAINQL